MASLCEIKSIQVIVLYKPCKINFYGTWFHFLASLYHPTTLHEHNKVQKKSKSSLTFPRTLHRTHDTQIIICLSYLFSVQRLVRSNIIKIATESLQAMGIWSRDLLSPTHATWYNTSPSISQLTQTNKPRTLKRMKTKKQM